MHLAIRVVVRVAGTEDTNLAASHRRNSALETEYMLPFLREYLDVYVWVERSQL